MRGVRKGPNWEVKRKHVCAHRPPHPLRATLGDVRAMRGRACTESILGGAGDDCRRRDAREGGERGWCEEGGTHKGLVGKIRIFSFQGSHLRLICSLRKQRV